VPQGILNFPDHIFEAALVFIDIFKESLLVEYILDNPSAERGIEFGFDDIIIWVDIALLDLMEFVTLEPMIHEQVLIHRAFALLR